MNSCARFASRLATAVTVPLPESRIAFQFLRVIAAVLSNPQRQGRVDMGSIHEKG
jgi:hypothetical protein